MFDFIKKCAAYLLYVIAIYLITCICLTMLNILEVTAYENIFIESIALSLVAAFLLMIPRLFMIARK